MKKNFLPLRRNENIVVQTLADETLVYDLADDQAFCLNETCGLVWQECDGTKTVADISRALSARLRSAVPEDLVYLALDNLHKKNLLIEDNQLAKMFSGISRREVIKKVGMATAVAIPVVLSIAAPASADAASASCAQTGGQLCVVNSTVPNQCCQPSFNCVFLSGVGTVCLPT